MTSITLIENEAPLIPIKTDKAGRRRLSREHKEALLDAFESSSMSGAQFAKKSEHRTYKKEKLDSIRCFALLPIFK